MTLRRKPNHLGLISFSEDRDNQPTQGVCFQRTTFLQCPHYLTELWGQGPWEDYTRDPGGYVCKDRYWHSFTLLRPCCQQDLLVIRGSSFSLQASSGEWLKCGPCWDTLQPRLGRLWRARLRGLMQAKKAAMGTGTVIFTGLFFGGNLSS